ncbi:MAG: hypothetical protein ABI876_09385 [Bacteroidota bacterium]
MTDRLYKALYNHNGSWFQAIRHTPQLLYHFIIHQGVNSLNRAENRCADHPVAIATVHRFMIGEAFCRDMRRRCADNNHWGRSLQGRGGKVSRLSDFSAVGTAPASVASDEKRACFSSFDTLFAAPFLAIPIHYP